MINLKINSNVQVTLEGLQKDSRTIPASAGYTKYHREWRNKLSELRRLKEIGKVVSMSGTKVCVEFPSLEHCIEAESYMFQEVKK